MAREWVPSPEFWRNRSVVVTGGTGFLGSHLVPMLLELGARTAVLVRDSPSQSLRRLEWLTDASIIRGSVEDSFIVERTLAEYQAQTVFHLAAQSQVEVAISHPTSTFESNIRGTWSVLEACRRVPGIEQVLVASSDKAYGSQPVLPYTEAMELLAEAPYDTSKACADLLSRSYAHSFSLPVAVTRCANFFGPGDLNWRRLVPGALQSMFTGHPPILRSDGQSTRDYLYVLDGARAYLCLAEALAADPSLRGQAFNFSNEEPLTVLALVGLLQEIVGTNFEPIILGRASHEITHQAVSSLRAHQLLGWHPSATLRQSLEETACWYRERLIQCQE